MSKPHPTKEVIKHNQNSLHIDMYGYCDSKQYRNLLLNHLRFLKAKLSRLKTFKEPTYDCVIDIARVKSELDIMEVETAQDIIYLPDREYAVRSISDIMYYEGLYGKAIYEKKEYLDKKIRE